MIRRLADWWTRLESPWFESVAVVAGLGLALLMGEALT